MKQTVATTTIFKAVLVFTFLFAGFLAIAIVYNRAYKMKNESISVIEKYEGATPRAIGIINNYLSNNGYTTKGNCKDGEYGVKNLNSTDIEQVTNNNEKYYYCISYYCATTSCSINSNLTPNGNKIFYKYKLFFKFNLPFLGELFTFEVTGETKGISLYSENQKL